MRSTQDMIAQINELFIQEKYAESNILIDELCLLGQESRYLFFCKGRNLSYLKHNERAIICLSRSVQDPEPFIWGHYELAMLHDRDANYQAAARHAIQFCEALSKLGSAEGLNQIHSRNILSCGHRVFEIDRILAQDLYRTAEGIGIIDYLSELRIAEHLITRGDLIEANERFRSLDSHNSLDVWGWLSYTRLMSEQHKSDQAKAVVERLLEDSKTGFNERIHVCHRAIDLDCYGIVEREIIELKLNASTAQRKAVSTLEFRALIASGPPGLAALESLMSSDREYLTQVDSSQLALGLYLLVERSRSPNDHAIDMGSKIIEELLRIGSFDVSCLHSILNYLIHTGDYQKGYMIVKSLDSTLLENEKVSLQHFDILCHTDSRQASEFYDRFLTERVLNQWESALVFRFLAGSKQDHAASNRLMRIIEEGHELPRDLHLLLQVCRRSDAQHAVLRAIQRRLAQGPTSDLELLRLLQQFIIDDLCVEMGRTEINIGGDILSISENNRFLITVDGRYVSHTPSESDKHMGTAGFICTNRGYFLSSLTFLRSFACTHAGKLGNHSWFIFLDDDVPEDWEIAISTALGGTDLEVEIKRERDFMQSPSLNFNEEYGIFAGGNRLARTAFFRIYAALYLSRIGKFRRICYFDTDIVCRNDLHEIFYMDMNGKALAARLEERNQDVEIAANQIGVDPSKYFNSGVLVFDLTNDKTLDCLIAALNASESKAIPLTFHDQCALNIGFAQNTTDLPKRLNFYLRPYREVSQDVDDATLLHFLDRPKPWDITFSREYRSYWQRYAEIISRVIPPSIYVEIVRAANGRSSKQQGSQVFASPNQ